MVSRARVRIQQLVSYLPSSSQAIALGGVDGDRWPARVTAVTPDGAVTLLVTQPNGVEFVVVGARQGGSAGRFTLESPSAFGNSREISFGTGILYVAANAPSGGDGSVYEPFNTFGAALLAASALSPSSSNRITVVGVDAATYVENVTVPAWVDVDAPAATLESASAVANTLQISDNCLVRFRKVVQGMGGPAAVVRLNTAGKSLFYADEVVLDDGIVAIINFGITQSAVLFARVESTFVNAVGGFGIGDATSAGHIHFEGGDVYLTANNAIGIQRGVAGTTVGRVEHVLELGSPTGTIAFLLAGGQIDFSAQTVSADTAALVTAPGILNLFAGSLVGTQSGTGTINITTP